MNLGDATKREHTMHTEETTKETVRWR